MGIMKCKVMNATLSVISVVLLFLNFETVFSATVINTDGQLTGYPCFKANPVTKNIKAKENWLKSAQLMAFCLEKYGSKPVGNFSLQRRVCDARDCKSCLSVCTMTSYKDEHECWSHCGRHNSSDACKRGCSFYLKIHGLITSEVVNFSSSAVPSTLITPQITKTWYDYSEVMWNQSLSESLIVYVIFSRVHYTDSVATGIFTPINITLENKINITASTICRDHSSADHHLGVEFSYDVAAVSMYGYNSSTFTSNSKALMVKGFKKIDSIANLSVPNIGALEVVNGRYQKITYKVNWNSDASLDTYVHYVEVSDKVSGCGIFSSIDHPTKVSTASQTANQEVNLPSLSIKECNFTFAVTPFVSCLQGIPKTKTIFYPGCHIFPNSTSECIGHSSTPTPLPDVIANVTRTYNYCESYDDPACPIEGKRTFCQCKIGLYNVKFTWELPSITGFLSIDCGLYEVAKYRNMVFFKPRGRWFLDKTARNVSKGHLEFGKNFTFKVQLKTSAKDQPLLTNLQGIDFNFAEVPVMLPSTLPGTTASTQPKGTRILSTLTNFATGENSKSSEYKAPLTVGLILTSVTVLFLLVVFAVLHKRKRDRANTLRLSDLRSVSYQANASDFWEIPLDNIVFGGAIGEGAFGKVYCATVSGVVLQSPSTSCESFDAYVKMGPSRQADFVGTGVTMKAAVKLLQDKFSAQSKSDFLEEINLMKNVGHHKNIVNMLGCVTKGPTLCLVVEYMPYGDLLNYLRGRRSKIIGLPVYVNTSLYVPKYCQYDTASKSTAHLVPPSPVSDGTVPQTSCNEPREHQGCDSISPEDLLRISWQIASGMEFLAQKGYVHRDLAARNVLVGPNNQCKISDFGLTRFVYEEKVYVGRKSRKLPLKWMSIEAIVDQRFTTFSDVWSFGVLLFEVVTLGGTPYPTMTGQELLRFLRAGNRMGKPENCSDEIFTIMKACWLTDPLSRPTFSDIKDRLELLISKGTPYVEFDFDATNPYYNVASFISVEESEGASLSDGPEEGEVGWERRFQSLDRGAAASFGDRYATDADGSNWLSTDMVEIESNGHQSKERGPLESTSSDKSTTPLADALSHCTAKMDNVTQFCQSSSLENESTSTQNRYKWCNDKEDPSRTCDLPSSRETSQAPFTVDHYVNFDP